MYVTTYLVRLMSPNRLEITLFDELLDMAKCSMQLALFLEYLTQVTF